MPENTDNHLRLLVSCVELKKEAWAPTDRTECSSILARQKDMANRSGSAFR